MGADPPALHLIVGPNGAGKSTLVADTIGPVTELPFVNAEVIAAEIWPDDPMNHAGEARLLAEKQHDDYIAEHVSFIAETVFSHPSKVDLVQRAINEGYDVTLHVVVIPKDLSLLRVAARVMKGGHDVPEQKTRDRWDRLWPLVARATGIATETILYDNSDPKASHRRFAVLRAIPATKILVDSLPAKWQLPEDLSALLDT